jgi:hypothetical protein
VRVGQQPSVNGIVVGLQGGVPVTRLRKTMLEELERRNFSQNTTRTYVRIVKDSTLQFRLGNAQATAIKERRVERANAWPAREFKACC